MKRSVRIEHSTINELAVDAARKRDKIQKFREVYGGLRALTDEGMDRGGLRALTDEGMDRGGFSLAYIIHDTAVFEMREN